MGAAWCHVRLLLRRPLPKRTKACWHQLSLPGASLGHLAALLHCERPTTPIKRIYKLEEAQ